MIFFVKVIPNAHKNSLVGLQDELLKLRIQAPPDKGKANSKLIEFLSEIFNIPKSQIEIVSGFSSRLKKVEVKGLSEEDFLRIIKTDS